MTARAAGIRGEALRSAGRIRAWMLPVLLVLLSGCGPREAAKPATTAPQPRPSAAPPVDLAPLVESLPLVDREAARTFYAARGGKPAWLGPDCQAQLRSLHAELLQATSHGLTPAHYHADALREAPCDARGEVLATDAWMALASDLFRGRVDRAKVEPHWNLPRRSFNAPVALQAALDSPRFVSILPGMAPQDDYYRALREMLALQRENEARGGWPGFAPGPKVKRGDRGARVDALRARLAAGGMLGDAPVVAGAPFDATLEEAVRLFQRRSNLEPDGVVGATTQAQLDRSAQDRVAQLRANLERWRWMQFAPGARHVRVYIADFRLEAWDANGTVHGHKVIVGKRYRNTPSFAGKIQRIVFAPRWHVPRRLLVEDKLPMFQRDPGAFHRLGFELFDADGEPVAGEVDWNAYSPDDFPYRLRQRPGAANALGQVKILFPNEHAVYLHDTPTRDLFAKVRRDFSSGCIRVEDALGLSQWLLRDKPEWNRARIDSAVAAGQETTVQPSAPVPVYIVYLTVAYDAEHGVRFLDDLYGRDPAVVGALDAG
jgi:murein L,D-transpeptidase YcbB/YkuD